MIYDFPFLIYLVILSLKLVTFYGTSYAENPQKFY